MKTMIMEHNVEELIRKKIDQVEQSPIDWKSEWVWSRIERPSRSKKSVSFYAAASVFIAIVSYSLYWMSLNYGAEITGRLNQVESQMDKMQPFAKPIEIVDAICEEGTLPQNIAVKRSNKSNSIEKSITPIAFIPILISSPDDSLIKSIHKNEVATTALERNLDFEVIVQERKIKPIIGKVPRSVPSVVGTKLKDLRVVVFNSKGLLKKSGTNSREYKILSARINNN